MGFANGQKRYSHPCGAICFGISIYCTTYKQQLFLPQSKELDGGTYMHLPLHIEPPWMLLGYRAAQLFVAGKACSFPVAVQAGHSLPGNLDQLKMGKTSVGFVPARSTYQLVLQRGISMDWKLWT